MTRPPEQSEALVELAARVEAASGPDVEIDVLIAQYINDIQPEGSVRWTWKASHISLPRYTASIDAAMTLGSDFGGQVTFFKDGTAKAYLWQPYPLAIEVKAATPALALTAAALRARSLALQPGGE